MRVAVCLAGPARESAWPVVLGADLVVAADAGARHALKAGRRPDLLVGDLDSLTAAEVEELTAAGVPVKRVSPDKDETDGDLAVREALAHRPRELVLVGALGGRPDHVLANLGLLMGACREGVRASAVDGGAEAHALMPGKCHELVIEGRVGWTFSVVPLPVSGAIVSITGVRWPLVSERIDTLSSRGISNRVVEEEARVMVHEGEAIAFLFGRV